MNPLKELGRQGQAVWLDYMRRSLITSGELQRMIKEDGVTGVTVNPTILEKSIAGSDDYDEPLKRLLTEDPHMDARGLYEALVIQDIQMAADLLLPVYRDKKGADGYISLELSPSLARDTAGSVAEARYLWGLVNRKNLMIKVPATPEGIPVIQTLIAEGINVNVTLIFSVEQYEAAAEAYLRGLEACADPAAVASVASFFVSRVDRAVDAELERIGTPEARTLRGRAAVSNSKVAYRRFKEIFSGKRWEALRSQGAKVQRLLWASTGTKNPAYSDVLYIEELIGPETVNTMPPSTMNAFRDHGSVRPTLEGGLPEAEASLRALERLGVELDDVTRRLLEEGLRSFSDSYDRLLLSLGSKGGDVIRGRVGRQVLRLGSFKGSVEERLKAWERMSFSRRLWSKDPTLWSREPVAEISNRLGWLELPEGSHDLLEGFTDFARELREEGVEHVLLLGMGGSSLAPKVFRRIFGRAEGYPDLVVLDSVHPEAIRRAEEGLDLRRTLFLVASKSGTTLEPTTLMKYFWENVDRSTGKPGRHFAAVTDPGTMLERTAREKGFRRVFLAVPDLGGRYSALTTFGLLPAALIGVKVHRLLDSAWIAAEGCAFCVSETRTPGLALGAALGELALAGRDKVTFLASKSIQSFPDWLEQLIAESTGKDGKGIVPVTGEPLLPPEAYGEDRVFVELLLEGEEDSEVEAALRELEAAGHPIIEIRLSEKEDIGMEIFRWEVAVASAGSVLGIHPFNQPDVEISKRLAREAMTGGAGGGSAEALSILEAEAVAEALRELTGDAKKGDYVALHAFLDPSDRVLELLEAVRLRLLNHLGLATTVGIGPGFLHSTGQLHKGGSDAGIFLQLVDRPLRDLPVPGESYTLGDVIRSQALGDYRALKERGRRVVRLDLGGGAEEGLMALQKIVEDVM